jgi:3',5'-cyclic AMP phosphodiesterase CpdA
VKPEQRRNAAHSTLAGLVRLLFALLLATVTSSAQVPELSLASPGAELRIAVVGDTGEGADAVAKGIARIHAREPLDAIIVTGDNFYPCGVTSETDPQWSLIRPLTRIGVPVLPVLGNHDYCGKADPNAQVRATAVVPNWTFPAREYAVRTPLADLVFVDTTPFVKGRTTAIESTIRDGFGKSAKKWRVVIGHHPVISSGYHGYRPKDEVAKMRALIPALRAARVDFYICGHDHHTELIRGRMLHLVSGAGSSPIPPIKLRLRTVYPNEIRLEPIGFAVVELTPKRIRVRIYDGEGRARSEWMNGRSR